MAEDKHEHQLVPLSAFQVTGSELVEAAAKYRKNQLAESVMVEISELVGRIEWIKDHMAATLRRLDFSEKQLAALQAGEFRIDSSDRKTKKLIFNDRELNRAWDQIE